VETLPQVAELEIRKPGAFGEQPGYSGYVDRFIVAHQKRPAESQKTLVEEKSEKIRRWQEDFDESLQHDGELRRINPLSMPLGVSDIYRNKVTAQAGVKFYADLLAIAIPEEIPWLADLLTRWLTILVESASLLNTEFAGPLRYQRTRETSGQEIERLMQEVGWNLKETAGAAEVAVRTVMRAKKDDVGEETSTKILSALRRQKRAKDGHK
jgi:hypothetical protein